MTLLSVHFSLEEFACKDGTPYPLDQLDEDTNDGRTWRETRLQPLVEMLEVIREALGKPLIVDSGYRTLAYDQRLFDADAGRGNVAKPTGSQHPKGRAADVRCASLTSTELRTLIVDLYAAGKIPKLGGVGWYPSFVHVDVRPKDASGHVAQWGGSRLSNIA